MRLSPWSCSLSYIHFPSFLGRFQWKICLLRGGKRMKLCVLFAVAEILTSQQEMRLFSASVVMLQCIKRAMRLTVFLQVRLKICTWRKTIADWQVDQDVGFGLFRKEKCMEGQSFWTQLCQMSTALAHSFRPHDMYSSIQQHNSDTAYRLLLMAEWPCSNILRIFGHALRCTMPK